MVRISDDCCRRAYQNGQKSNIENQCRIGKGLPVNEYEIVAPVDVVPRALALPLVNDSQVVPGVQAADGSSVKTAVLSGVVVKVADIQLLLSCKLSFVAEPVWDWQERRGHGQAMPRHQGTRRRSCCRTHLLPLHSGQFVFCTESAHQTRMPEVSNRRR